MRKVGETKRATIDMADELYPPLTYLPVEEDIPIGKVYGKHKPNSETLEEAAMAALVNTWLHDFENLLLAGEQKAIDEVSFQNLFLEEACWKDHLVLGWDFHQYYGADVVRYVNTQLPTFKLRNLCLKKDAYPHNSEGININVVHPATSKTPPVQWIEAIFDLENEYGYGRGIVRLLAVEEGLRALSIYTGLDIIKGNEVKAGQLRSQGVNHDAEEGRSYWKELRQQQFEWGGEKQPEVVIVGGGHSGLNIAARLKYMGVESLILERNERIGDNWRLRYKFLVLHDPVWADHLPYMPFPEIWPIYTPKDKLGDWFESYANSLELSFWTNKTVVGAKFHDDTSTWDVNVRDNSTGEEIILHPKHVVMATGHSGEPNIPAFKDQDKFKGEIIHTSKYTTGKNYAGKNAVVVGCCSSGHDIAQDFCEQGAKATMVQRSSTYVYKAAIGNMLVISALYGENSPAVEISDLITNSLPYKLNNLLSQQAARKVYQLEYEQVKALGKAGFKLDAGYGGTGLLGKYHRYGGGYYIDVGCSKLISEGKIKVQSGSIERFTENGLVFSDGSKIDDVAIVVLATGYSNMKDTAKKIFGEDIAKHLNPVWGLDDEGEFSTMWRPSGHRNFWFMGGNLLLTRFYSVKLALQIIAGLRGFI